MAEAAATSGEKYVRPDLIIKFLLWVVPLVFVAGGLYTMIESTAEASTAAMSKASEMERSNEKEHSDLKEQRAVMESKIIDIRDVQSDMLQEQKRQGENISAICQVTKAKCR